VAVTTEPLRTVRDRLSEFVERVEQEHERVMITRNGRPAAVLVSPDDIEALEETLELLTASDAMRDLRDAKLRSPRATSSAALRTFVGYLPNEAPGAYGLVVAGPSHEPSPNGFRRELPRRSSS
jgi:prevent-host-death family protein